VIRSRTGSQAKNGNAEDWTTMKEREARSAAGPTDRTVPPERVSLATVIDIAGAQILHRWAEGGQVRAIRVSPPVYQAIAHARAREVARGYPLLLLDFDLVQDDTVPLNDPVVVSD